MDSSDTHFIRCIKPNEKKAKKAWDEGSVLRQLKCSGVMEAVRVIAGEIGFATNLHDPNRVGPRHIFNDELASRR